MHLNCSEILENKEILAMVNITSHWKDSPKKIKNCWTLRRYTGEKAT